MSNGAVNAPSAEVDLAHRYRRWLFYCLFTYANPMYLPDIARQITVWEGTADEVDPNQHQLTVYDALYHEHLPPLREAGLVTYHQQDDEVELGPAAEHIEAPLRERLAAEIDALLTAETRAIDADRTPE